MDFVAPGLYRLVVPYSMTYNDVGGDDSVSSYAALSDGRLTVELASSFGRSNGQRSTQGPKHRWLDAFLAD